MKKSQLIFYSLTLLALCGLTFSSCGGDDPDPPVVIKPVITLDSEIANFTYIGGEKTFEVKVDQPDVKWTAKESENWVKITNETATGFTIEIPQWNETGVDPRKATVTVSAGTADPKVINITQTPADAPEPYFDVDDEDIEFAQQGGSETVEVDANVSWEVKSEDSWITISEKTDGSFKVTTQPNNTSRLLEGTITVSCGMEEFEDVTIKVTQDFTPAELSIDLEELEQAFSYKENSFSFTVDSNVEYTVTPTITADEEGVNDWLTITNDGDEYTVTIDRNFTSDGDRTAKITVAANEEDIVSPIVIDVTQRKVEWKAGLFFPNGNEDEIPAAGGSARFPSISYNDPDETVCDADWVTVTHQSPNMYVLIASAEANTTGETREAKIYVYSDFGEESVGRTILTVTQENIVPELNIDLDPEQREQSFSFRATELTFTVTSNMNYTVTPEVNADEDGSTDWLTVSNVGDVYTVSLDHNLTSGEDRTATVTIAGVGVDPIVIDVTQRKPIVTNDWIFIEHSEFSPISPLPYNFPAEGGSFMSQSAKGDTHAIICEAEWITATTSNPNVFTLTVVAEENTTGEERSASIYAYQFSSSNPDAVLVDIIPVTQSAQ